MQPLMMVTWFALGLIVGAILTFIATVRLITDTVHKVLTSSPRINPGDSKTSRFWLLP